MHFQSYQLKALNIPVIMTFQVPRKAVLSPEQLESFQTSKTHQEIISYIESLNDAVVGAKLTDECSESSVRDRVVGPITLPADGLLVRVCKLSWVYLTE